MDIERLKELQDYLRVANELSILNDDNLMQRIVESNDVTNTIDIAIELLKAEIARQSVKNEEVHLCNDCEYGCMAACPITKNVKFGNGQGNDNVIECENYINKEALKKWRINQIILRGRG